jgi:2-oxoglutarate dehydrogenase E2 component (dihydrolipoamide succinyltransferase)
MPNILVPQLGESVVEARVSRWLKKVGEDVSAGEPVVELETDKIDLEVGSDQPGVLAKIERQEGEDVKVGELLAVVEPSEAGRREPGDGSRDPQSSVGPNFSSAEPTPEPQAGLKSSLSGDESRAATTEPDADIRATATARRMAEEHALDLSRVPGSGDGGRITKDDVQRFLTDPRSGVGRDFSPAEGVGRDVSPAAPAEAKHERTLPVARIEPGPSDMGPRPGTPAESRVVPGPGARAEPARPETRERMSKRRLTIARRLVEAQRTAAMLTTFNEVDMSAIMALRARRKESFQKQHGVNLGLSSFFVKASIGALRAFPRLNAEIDGEEMVLKHYYDIGIAVGAPQGLVVPVLRDADGLSFAEIEKTVRDFAKRAEDGTLTLEDLKGGSFTITNGGVFGSLLSTPILNPPQVGILGLHKIEERPVAADGQVAIKPMMYLALSYDHRIVDGNEAVRFLVKIKELIEDPGSMLIEQ